MTGRHPRCNRDTKRRASFRSSESALESDAIPRNVRIAAETFFLVPYPAANATPSSIRASGKSSRKARRIHAIHDLGRFNKLHVTAAFQAAANACFFHAAFSSLKAFSSDAWVPSRDNSFARETIASGCPRKTAFRSHARPFSLHWRSAADSSTQSAEHRERYVSPSIQAATESPRFALRARLDKWLFLIGILGFIGQCRDARIFVPFWQFLPFAGVGILN